jgi:hypothetical protein
MGFLNSMRAALTSLGGFALAAIGLVVSEAIAANPTTPVASNVVLNTDTAIVAPGEPHAAADALELGSVTVKAVPGRDKPGHADATFIRKIPTAMNDPIRVVSYLPGVAIQSDLNIRPLVRGGNAEQTQVVLNGLPLLQPYHVGGVFSIFNLGVIEGVELYRENFQVQDPGALSGVLHLKPQRASLESARLKTNVSLVRGDAFAEVPVIKNRLSLYGGGQAFLFNRSLHGLLDVAAQTSQEEQFQQDIQGYRNHINLPDFQDYHWGAHLQISEALQLHYAGCLALDHYAVVIPKAVNIITKPSTSNPGPVIVPTVMPRKEINRTKKLSIDSISAVDIDNQYHFVNLPWDITDRLFLEQKFGYQSQGWDVDFKKELASSAPLRLDQSTRFFNYQASADFAPSEPHRFTFGFGYDYKEQRYDTEIPFVLYDVIVNSNLDMLSGLGFFTDEGFRIAKADSSRSNFDYLGAYPSRIRFSHQGELFEHFGSAFFAHEWKQGRGQLNYGVRIEYQSTSKEAFAAPRASYAYSLSEKNTLTASGGIYSQNNLPYFQRDVNPSLRSEKAAQFGLQWVHRFSPGYRFEWQNYYKRYFDLVSPTLVPAGSIDLGALLLPHPQSPLSENEIADLKSTLDTTRSFETLPDSVRQAAYATFGDLEFAYANTGDGHGLGTELAFFYQPKPAWTGWLSVDLSLSQRRDAPHEAYYAYRYHRPVVMNWVNHFDLASRYAISLTYRWAMGQPYTPYTGTMDGKDLMDFITVGARNSGRLAPYSRLDLRLTRNAQMFGSPFKTYIEVWNSMNDPNYFARDERTGELKSAQLNWPFPLLFIGLSWEL